jgi:ectoine hydroxylase-related dioxygenase (phytanoyl-CoA dioxygenase family)
MVMGIEPLSHLSRALNNWGLDARLVDPCKDLIGKDALVFFTEKVNYKRARKGGSIILHQDFPYWIPLTDKAHEIATAMVFIDDATVENGCLEVAPGSHREGVQKRWDGEFGRSFEMDTNAFDMTRLVPVEVPRGSALFFGPLLVHRSLPNRSNDDRRALLYSYQPAGYPHAREIRIRRAAEAQSTSR